MADRERDTARMVVAALAGGALLATLGIGPAFAHGVPSGAAGSDPTEFRLSLLEVNLDGVANDELGDMVAAIDALRAETEDVQVQDPSPTAEPSDSPDAQESPEPSETPDAQESPKAAETPEASETPEPSETPDATQSDHTGSDGGSGAGGGDTGGDH